MRRGLRMAAVWTLVAGFPGAAAIGSGHRVDLEQTERLEVPAGGLQRLELDSKGGDIEIRALEAVEPFIQVEVTKQASGPTEDSARKCLLSMRLESKDSGDKLKLGWDWTRLKKKEWAYAAHYRIVVPPHLELRIKTNSGDIDIQGVAGDLDLRTKRGDIVVRGGVGELEAHAHYGELDLSTAAPEVDIKNHHGPIHVELTAAGSIEGDIKGHNGPITVQINPSASARLDCKAHHGTISSQLPLQLEDVEHHRHHHKLKGRLGAGGEKLKIRAHRGSITLR